ncbi:hypothetical protein L1887_22822 [Cichorium endivia]|nr:hypothetical protein L1887_22822 [Cichorium endivia]
MTLVTLLVLFLVEKVPYLVRTLLLVSINYRFPPSFSEISLIITNLELSDLSSVLVDSSMAATFPTPPVKKPTIAFPPRRGRVKAQIFEGVAETVAYATSRAGDFLGLFKKDDSDTPVDGGSAPAPPPKTTKTYGEDGRTV